LPCPTFFNGNVILCGLAALAGGFGLSHALAELSGRRGWSVVAGASISLWGLAIVIGGLYPMPDERHGAFGLAIVGQFTPLFTLIALNRVEGVAPLKSFLAFIFLASLALFAVMMGAGELVTRANVGVWQRTYGVLSIPYLAILGWVLLRRTEQIRTA
jgi:hypothetical protein